MCNNIAPGHIYGRLATLGQLSAVFGIRWLVHIFQLGITFIIFRLTFRSIILFSNPGYTIRIVYFNHLNFGNFVMKFIYTHILFTNILS